MKAPRLIGLAGAALLAATVSSGVLAQAMPQMPPQPPELPPAPWEVDKGSPFVIYPIRNGVYMISGPKSNVTVQVGAEGVFVVDTGPKENAEALLTQIRRISRKPILYIVNTNADAEDIGGNQVLAASGELLEGGNTRPRTVTGSGGAPIWSHESVLNHLTADGMTDGIPTVTYFVGQKDIFFNGEPVSLLNYPGHSRGDSFVMFRRSDVISAGENYTPDRYPTIDLKHGGSIQGVLDALNGLILLTIPEFNEEGGTYVVPAHGRLSDEGDVADYRDMITFIRDRVRGMIAKRMTLAQIKTARPTFDYDPMYGKEAGDAFVEQVYQSLTSKGAKK